MRLLLLKRDEKARDLSPSSEDTARKNPPANQETCSHQTQTCCYLDLGLPSLQYCMKRPCFFSKEIPHIKYNFPFIYSVIAVVFVVAVILRQLQKGK